MTLGPSAALAVQEDMPWDFFWITLMQVTIACFIGGAAIGFLVWMLVRAVLNAVHGYHVNEALLRANSGDKR